MLLQVNEIRETYLIECQKHQKEINLDYLKFLRENDFNIETNL